MNKEQLIALGLTPEHADKVIIAHKATLSGEYVPKHRFDDVNGQLTTANTTIKERDGQLKTLQDSTEDVDGLKKQITKLTEDNTTAATTYAIDLESTKVSNALKLQLMNDELGKPHDINMVAGLFDIKQLKLNDEGKIIDGYATQNTNIRKEKEFLFNKVVVTDPNKAKPQGWKPAGTTPPEGGGGGAENKSVNFGAGLAAKKLNMMGVQPKTTNE